MVTAVLAFDFGASGGRAIRGEYDGTSLRLREVHRFENVPQERDGTLCWDFDGLLGHIREGIAGAGDFQSLAVDTWGVDFGLLGKDGKLLAPPVHYRDSRTDGMAKKAAETMSPDALYAATGNQIMDINTLFQLLAIKERRPELLDRAETLLFMPDLFGYFLTGKAACERTIASTGQLLDPRTGEWARGVAESYGLPVRLLGPVVPSGTVLGDLLPEFGVSAKVIAAAGHDTQCAVAAAPEAPGEAAFLSCGTWSLLGCELEAPILTPESRALGLSNELGADGRVNYLKNIIGLWLIQESRREWRRQGKEYSYADLEREALAAPAFACFIDPDAPEFAPPGDLPGRVREFCRRTGQRPPETVGGTMRCIYESLALKYRFALNQLERTTGKRFGTLRVLGGGAKDRLLCQMAADCCGVRVTAGPVEATALGNLALQLTALGAVEDLNAAKVLIRETEPLKIYEPGDKTSWDQAFARFCPLPDTAES